MQLYIFYFILSYFYFFFIEVGIADTVQNFCGGNQCNWRKKNKKKKNANHMSLRKGFSSQKVCLAIALV